MTTTRAVSNQLNGFITERNVVVCARCLERVHANEPFEKITPHLGPWDHYPICETCGAVIETGVRLSASARADLAAERLRSGLARIWSQGRAWYYAQSNTPRSPHGGYNTYMEAFDALCGEVG